MNTNKINMFAIAFVLMCFLFSIGIAFLVINSDNGFTEYEYGVVVERCKNNKNDTTYFKTKRDFQKIETYRQAVPDLFIGRHKIINVCDYHILYKKEINDKK